MSRCPRPLLVTALAVLAATAGSAGSRAQTPSAAVDPVLYKGMQWRSVGPARGGRSIAVGGSESRPHEYWFGTTGGGAWKTTDGGTTWAPMTDGKIRSSSIGALGVCQADPDVVYIGGGEVQFRGNIIQGDG
ncbi:MAG: glycosyl hydrolase, partial [Vicinamibacterales bacterium]